MKLLGKVAIVTGASGGIGAGIALELAREGADVLVNYARNREGAEQIVRQIQELGRRAVSQAADLANLSEIETMVQVAADTLGAVDILVNNSGITEKRSMFDVTEADWDRTLDINLKGAFFASCAASKRMIQAGKGGKIINISSVQSRAGVAGLAPYAASKGGLNQLTVEMALELAPHAICVNAIAPGTIEVERLLKSGRYQRQQHESQIPLGRVGTPEDVARPVVFFASADSDYITGQILFVDGGLLAKLPVGNSTPPAPAP